MGEGSKWECKWSVTAIFSK